MKTLFQTLMAGMLMCMSAVTVTYADQTDWMKAIDGNVYVRQLSIPGAHDAASNSHVSLATFSQTQSKSIAQMLTAGVRFFDLRPKPNNGDMPLYHGISSTNYTLRSALTEIGDFLAEHSDELVIVMVRDESDGGGAGNFFPYLKTILTESGKSYSGRFVRFKAALKLSECRGKILMISRENPGSDATCPIDFLSGSGGWNTYDFANMRGARINGVWVYGQDYWEIDNHANKQKGIIRMLQFSQSGLTRRNGHHTWVFNSTSGYKGSISTASAYAENAAYQNSRVVEYLKTHHGPVGIMMMDYAADDNGKSKATKGLALTQALIDNNAYIQLEPKNDDVVKTGTKEFVSTPTRETTLRAPSVPLFVSDPYFQVWSNGDNLSSQNTTHRDGAAKRMYAYLRVDGKCYRLMGLGDQRTVWMGRDATCRYKSASSEDKNWTAMDFDDSQWTEGIGPFNGGDTHNGWTEWSNAGQNDLFVRYHVQLNDWELSQLDHLRLRIAYDQDPVVYINGVQAWSASGWKENGSDVSDIELDYDASNMLVEGDNVIAVKVGRGGGGQFLTCQLEATLLNGQPLTATQSVKPKVMASQTYYQLKAGTVNVDLTFTNPQRLDKLDLLSTPIDYLSYKVTPTDGKNHNVQFYLMLSPEFVASNNDYGRYTTQMEAGGLKMVRCGHDVQEIGASSRADWGYLYVVAEPTKNQDVCFGYDATRFLADGRIPGRPLTGARHELFSNGKVHPFIVFKDDLGRVEAGKSQYGFATIGYDYDGKAVHDADGGQGTLPNYYTRQGLFTELLRKYVANYSTMMASALEWDERVFDDALETGGEKYAQLASLAYRQTAAAHTVAKDKNGAPLVYNMSAGFWQKMQSADVIYAVAPLLLSYEPALVLKNLLPTIQYYNIPEWTSTWAGEECAPHTLGNYPWIGSSESNGRLESNANLLLVAAVAACLDADTKFFIDHYTTLKSWADNTLLYLNGTKSMTNEWSLDSDAFGTTGGSLKQSRHLSAKAILAIAGMGRIAKLVGNTTDATRYATLAASYAATWKQNNQNGNHYVQADDVDWGQKYALVYDQLLGTNLFADVIDKELTYYQSKIATYGLPIDGRSNIGALGETLASAAMGSETDWTTMLTPVYKYVNTTSLRVPLRTSYNTSSGSSWGNSGIDDGNTQKGSPLVGLLWTKQLKGLVPEVDTGVFEITESSVRQHDTAVYDLQGRRVAEKNLKSGLYIVQGKKRWVK
ncbi:phosphatidylinositol-specific phospholipase C domain-containing protein [Prevotella sp. E9-3]|uniref:phosphatidylinositol-specific phospholipase C domain-containing protein n=1 Tax=Prevotella sp. E9-3 TaxID=2913621 RepID=UPI001EDBB263|nr:phosphatidylinositol-specific phospholipase C domain-containing protein [Prevotella sp. E9-3]UKK48656.1 phosphatidylinositol-specific phospholipase C domain-containing protein [Prevotella sp. E9-3]